MPLQNRVTPEGDIRAVPERGTMYGNRGGCFHRTDRSLKARRFATKQWICCVLSFKGRRRRLMQSGLFTELFFLDEATAFAAGHRPCFECRRADAVQFAALWNAASGAPGRAAAAVMDDRLQRERIDPHGGKVVSTSRMIDVPDGAMIRRNGQAELVLDGQAHRWSFSGYEPGRDVAPDTTVTVLTPLITVAILRLGYQPQLHPSARATTGSRAPRQLNPGLLQ